MRKNTITATAIAIAALAVGACNSTETPTATHTPTATVDTPANPTNDITTTITSSCEVAGGEAGLDAEGTIYTTINGATQENYAIVEAGSTITACTSTEITVNTPAGETVTLTVYKDGSILPA